MRFLLLLTAVICVSTVTAQTAARSYFKISPNILEGIRDILNRGNQEALQSVSTEVLEKIQELVEAEIEKFRYLGQKPRFAVESYILMSYNLVLLLDTIGSTQSLIHLEFGAK